MKIFVTGGNGFIGSKVVRRLVAGGNQVKCLLRKTSNTHRLDWIAGGIKGGVDFEPVIGDVRDLESLVNGMAGCDGVIHLASLSNWDDIHSPLMREVVVEGSRNVMKAAVASGNLKTVYVSSITAVGATETPEVQNENSLFTLRSKAFSYAKAKNEVEGICRGFFEQGLPVVIVNPGEVYGEDDTQLVTAGNLIDFAKSNPVLVCNGGVAVVHVEDVAAGIEKALQKGKPGERYILAAENLSIRQLAEITLKALGQRKKIINVPNGLISFIAKAGSVCRIPLPFNPAVIPYATKYWYMDNSKAKKELGMDFKSAEHALKCTVDWLFEAGLIQQKGNG